jgi:copper chaperone
MSTQVFQVSGMTCDHCVAAVTEEVGAIPGVESVSVALSPGATSDVTVSSGQPLEIDAVRAAVDEAGYELVE